MVEYLLGSCLGDLVEKKSVVLREEEEANLGGDSKSFELVGEYQFANNQPKLFQARDSVGYVMMSSCSKMQRVDNVAVGKALAARYALKICLEAGLLGARQY